MPKKIDLLVKYAIFGALGAGNKQSQINEFYKKLKSLGHDGPHPNTVKSFAKEYNNLDDKKKQKIKMRYSVWSARDMPKDVPAVALPTLYAYKRMFDNWQDGNYLIPFEHLKYARLANVFFTKGLAKWLYYVLCGLNLEIPSKTDWFTRAGVWVQSINRTPIFITHIDILRIAEFQESVDITQIFGDVSEFVRDPFSMVTNILLDERYNNPDGDLFVLSDADNQFLFEANKRFFNEEYAREVELLISKARANDYLKATAKGDWETINKINEEKTNKQIENFQEYVKENNIPDTV